ncbi:MAG: hypothetical protein H7Z18_08535 [Methylophilaceae bacterium]|nr:hypothetical protein [Methylophilaceae bacterium]
MLKTLSQQYRCNILFIVITLSYFFQIDFVFSATTNQPWHPGIGDPDAFGWITVLSYLIAVIKVFNQLLIHKKQGDKIVFWVLLTLFLGFLGFNKQLDLQTLLRQTVVSDLMIHHFYVYRRYIQISLMLLMALTIMIVLIKSREHFVEYWQQYKLICIGVTLLFLFIFTRALTFQFHDLGLSDKALLLEKLINFIMENSAIMCIILGASSAKKTPHTLNMH